MLEMKHIDGVLLKKMYLVAANSLEKNKEMVDALNVFPVPDGDTGTNMSLTIQSAIRKIKDMESTDVDEIASSVAKGSLMGARGNSGVILSQLFRGFANGLKGHEEIDTKVIADAFKAGSDTAYKAVMKPTEGTILTVARECAEKALEISKIESDIVTFLKEVIKHGEVTLDRTPEMLDVLKQAGVVDAGGQGFIFILKGALKALTSDDEFLYEDVKSTESKAYLEQNIEEGDIEFGYCTEFIINNTTADAEDFKTEVSALGDSLFAVGGEDIIKVHIHTNNPGTVLQKALKFGELIDIKIDNMRYEHRSKMQYTEEADEQSTVSQIQEETRKYSFIAVGMGKGIADVFSDLKVDYVIAGGQTMNPSTEDILNAIENVKGENIIILPNNSNIIMAATQAKEISDRNVEVIPTKTIPQGVAALVAFDNEYDIKKNSDNMKEAILLVKTGQVTFSVRDTVINDVEIKKDNIIGINDGNIVSVGEEVEEVSIDLIKKLVDEDSYLITIFYGEDVTEEEAQKLADVIEAEAEDCDVEIVYGGQPLYYYIFSIE